MPTHEPTPAATETPMETLETPTGPDLSLEDSLAIQPRLLGRPESEGKGFQAIPMKSVLTLV